MLTTSSGVPTAQRNLRRGLLALGLVAFGLACGCYASYCVECSKLREIAEKAAPLDATPSDRILAMTDWVYRNKGFRENENYFVWSKLRATPVQVLEGGGDCADKSRLLAAMLRQVGIEATMVMCFDRRTGAPSHTVVEAKAEEGRHMVVDPVYRLWFPRPDGRGYYDLLDLRHDPTIVDRRIAELLAVAPRNDPLRSYNSLSAAYDRASSINWDKNVLTRFVGDRLRNRLGEQIHRLGRPTLLEEPKLFVMSVLGGVAGVFMGAAAVVGRLSPSRQRPLVLRSSLACGL